MVCEKNTVFFLAELFMNPASQIANDNQLQALPSTRVDIPPRPPSEQSAS
jgi:hypothetical protein